MSEQATGAAFPVGTRVREREVRVDRPPKAGMVVPPVCAWSGRVAVRWDTDVPGTVPENVHPEHVEVIPPPAPPRSPERVLAPGIVISDDTCDGRPRLAGTRMPTRATVGWKDYEAFSAAHPHVTSEAYTRGVLFEAGVRWAKARRKAKRAKQAKGGTRG